MRNVGSNVRLSSMLNRSCVADRVKSENGISYLEFSYQLFQAYDFFMLNKKYNCKIQVGGSDQWGNITAGIDLVNKLSNERVDGICLPLLTANNGIKLGKTAGNAIWLNENKTSDVFYILNQYIFYQYLINQPENNIDTLLLSLTDLEIKDINDILKYHKEHEKEHYAQKILADYVTKTIRGEKGLDTVKLVSNILFGIKPLIECNENEINEIINSIPNKKVNKNIFEKPITTVLSDIKLCVSKSIF